MRTVDDDFDLFSDTGKPSVPETFSDISSRSDPEGRDSSGKGGKRRKKRRKRRVLRLLLVIFLLLLVLLPVTAYFYAYNALEKIERFPLDTGDLGITTNTYADVKNIALLGVDSRDDDLVGRSDAIMIISINRSAKKIKLISIARDSRVSIDGHGQDKLTHAYAYGRAQLAVKTLNQNFGLEITDCVTMNFFGLSRAIDFAGGVTVDIDEKEMKEMNTNIIPYMAEMGIPCDPIKSAGKQHVSGAQAVSYARIRHTDSDIERGNRQKEVITALFDSVKHSNPFTILKIAEEILGECQTSLDTKTMLHTGLWSLFVQPEWEELSIPNDDIPASGSMIGGVWYYSYDLEQAKQVHRRFILEE